MPPVILRAPVSVANGTRPDLGGEDRASDLGLLA
jgi:hypothetical protein